MKVGTPGDKNCLNCKFAAAEPDDGIVCYHPSITIYTLGLYIKHMNKHGCGAPDYQLFEEDK